MKYRMDFKREERHQVGSARSVKHQSSKELTRSHHRSKPYDRLRENRHRHKDRPTNPLGNQTSRENHLDRNRYATHMNECTSRSHLQDKMSRGNHQDRNRSTRHRQEDNFSSYHRDQKSKESHQNRNRLVTHRYESRSKDVYFQKHDRGDMSRSDEWIVTPGKNSKEENDDLAAKIFTVLLNEGGKLKKRELEAYLGAEPLTMRFLPKESFSRFLEVYENIFDISDVSNGEREEGEITDPEVTARSDIQICLHHSSSSQACSGDCNNLHICKFKLISDCPFEYCRFGHDLQTDHNQNSLKHHFMQFLRFEQIRFLISELEHRKGVTVPSICTYYNKIKGCNEPIKCPHLHVCAFIAGKCAFQPDCKRSHNLEDDQPRKVLSKFGINIEAHNKNSLLKMLKLGSLHSPEGQGQVISKITHPNRHTGSVQPVQTGQEETEDTQEATLPEPRSEFDKRPRYWDMACKTNTDSP